MILVLCLNPAVDKTCVVKRFVAHRLNRLEEVVTLPGGKGINVARVLKSLGQKPLVLGFTAGYTGAFIAKGLRREGIPTRWIELARGESRICLSVMDGGKSPTEANESGPTVVDSDVERLLRAYGGLLRRASLVILSGSLPQGCPSGIYARMIRMARERRKPVFLDASLAALSLAVAEGPDLVKINADEAASLRLRLNGRGSQPKAIGDLLSRGPLEAVVTLGAQGAVGSLGGRLLRAVPPPVKSLSPVGCGDTFLAALAHARLRRFGPERALAYATALATASATVLGAGVYRPADVPGVLARTRVSRLAA